MRIGMMTDIYKPHISGVTNYISLNKSILSDQGHEIYVFTFGDSDYIDNEPNIYRSPGLPLLDTGFHLNLGYSQEARTKLVTMDVVHVHHPFLSGSIALRYCRPRGLPIVFTNHTRYDLYAQAYIPGLPEVFGVTALEAIMPAFCRACDLVIAPSPGMKSVLEKFGVTSHIDVVPNGVNLAPFKKPTQPKDRSEFGFQPDDILLIYVGRLGPEKNLPFLLRSFAGAAQAYDNIRLILVGDGPEKDNLQDRVRHMQLSHSVFFTGMLEYAQLPGYLTMADAFVTASVTEVHPLSVIEAMASGLPVLGIQSPGVGDTIVDGITGFLVPEQDFASYTAKLVRLATDHDKRKYMGQEASLASEKYAIEHTSKIMVDRYAEVIQDSREKKRGLRTRFIRMMDKWRN
ncbi:MAG: glycosyltransferase [Anaerolineales bacterium]|nr:MAG: glycosyltransferase [Anaerolineales bacterium]